MEARNNNGDSDMKEYEMLVAETQKRAGTVSKRDF